jgi:biliverdin reductase
MVQFGLVGTGFVAHKRAEALAQDGRGRLVAVAGHVPSETEAFARQYNVEFVSHWSDLVSHPAVDVVLVCNINRDHGAVAVAALAAGKHVVVEYPLALRSTEARNIIAQARAGNRFLHVEHIELLGGMHQALKANLAAVGTPYHAAYRTFAPRHPAPDNWTYCPALFGFPLVGALSRIHRLVDCFGPVAQVYCQNRYEGLRSVSSAETQYTSCLCMAQLTFQSGLLAEVVYAKGGQIWQSLKQLTVSGSGGGLILDTDQGQLIGPEKNQGFAIGSRRGLFAADTRQVLDHLLAGKPMYCIPEASLYSLQVAEAAQQSATIGQAVKLGND